MSRIARPALTRSPTRVGECANLRALLRRGVETTLRITCGRQDGVLEMVTRAAGAGKAATGERLDGGRTQCASESTQLDATLPLACDIGRMSGFPLNFGADLDLYFLMMVKRPARR